IPNRPDAVYQDWKGWGDWLGNVDQNGKRKKGYLDFEYAREYVHSLNLASRGEWEQYRKLNRPLNIPANPDRSRWIKKTLIAKHQ
ncbi:MAG: hypothetical protein ACJ71G_02510, partial [Nitrososphaeraceae archaeon]